MSIHLEAKAGEIAPTVLLPGDPLRAKWIAETFLENTFCYNQVRGMLGFTGTYHGRRVSVQGSGMGIPSTMVYCNELIKDYGVQRIIRVGSAGSYQADIKLNDLVVAMSASTDSNLNGRRFPNAAFARAMETALRDYARELAGIEARSPYGVPYEPRVWGAGWSIQRFGMQHYYLHRAMPEAFPEATLFNALNFILGVHPGSNTESFVSGVGADSMEVAYGVNRADESFIPGGSGSGTALIRPDFPELLEWPFLWQQTEYVMGGGTTDYLFLALAAEAILRDR